MRLTGLGVSPGIGVGRALVLKRSRARPAIPGSPPPSSIASSRGSRKPESVRAGRSSRSRTGSPGAAGRSTPTLFDAQLLMLDDAMLIGRASTIIRNEHLNAASALQRALDEISALFDEAQDSYLRERKGDVADVVGRLCMNLRTAMTRRISSTASRDRSCSSPTRSRRP